MSAYQPRKGPRCTCRPGVQRDNCASCEGTGWQIDFAAIRARAARVYVVTIMEEAGVTRCAFAEGTAHDFLAWIAAKGRHATLRVMEVLPARDNAEAERAVMYAEEFTRENL